MAEYLEREAIMKFPIREDQCDKEHANEHFIFGIESVLEYVENLPAADVAPVVHGRWIECRAPHAMGGISAKCSACNKNVQYLGNPLNYCPNCGAKMDGEENAED